MKKAVLCISALVACFLIFSTIFSLRVERWMVPAVTLADAREEGIDMVLSLDCLFDTEDGPTLFAPYEGAAWEAGARARIMEPYSYWLTENRINVIGNSTVIAYATKLPRPDMLVDVIITPTWEPDAWLAVAREDALPEWGTLDRRAAIQTQTSREALITLEKAPTPFMEKRAWTMAPMAKHEDDLTAWADETGHVDKETVDWAAVEASRQRPPRFYSMNDFKLWLAQIPKIGLMLGSILASLALWAFSCALAGDPQRNRRRLALNGGLLALSLGAVTVLLFATELPSSLLPVAHVMDFEHYSQEFSNIFGALDNLAAAGDPTAAELAATANAQIWLAIGLGAALLLLAVAWGVGQVAVRKKDTRREGNE